MYIPFKKKQFGQHFLRKQSVVDNMIDRVDIDNNTTVMEIGCGGGFLTQAILLQTNCKKLRIFEIDHEWAEFVRNKIRDKRIEINVEDILRLDFSIFKDDSPLVLLANLPYQITFPILFLLQKNKHLFKDGVLMMQEEVAQKLVAKRGRSYSATSIFLQHHFEFELMEKVEPEAFSPSPNVFSRLVYFKPRISVDAISDELEFWKFLRVCFVSPRRTLQNNLKNAHYKTEKLSKDVLKLRAQQIPFEQFLQIWEDVSKKSEEGSNEK